MRSPYFLAILCVTLIWPLCHCKKSKKLQGMLQKAQDSHTPSRVNIESIKSQDEEVSFNLPGVLHKIKLPGEVYEYEGKHATMTSEEAIELCESDPACGGFTFNGIDVPGRKHFIFFLHLVPQLGKNAAAANPFWTLYRSKKKIIKLPGAPLVQHEKRMVKETDEIRALRQSAIANKHLVQDWPQAIDELASVTFGDNGPMTGEKAFIMKDHDFSAPTTTLINVLAKSNLVFDGSTKQFWPCCKNYSKPLEDPELRFYDFHDTIQTVDCEGLTKKEFEETYVRPKVPVKVKNCFSNIPRPDLQSIIWSGSYYRPNTAKKYYYERAVGTKEMERLIKDGATLDLQGQMQEETPVMKSLKFLPDHILKHRADTSFISYSSKGTGSLHTKDLGDTFQLQHEGAQWLVIFPPGVGTVECRKGCSDKVPQIWEASTWFDNLQPQLIGFSSFGKPVVQTKMEAGDLVYIPSDAHASSYALEDSISVSNFIMTVGGIETIHNAFPIEAHEIIKLSEDDMAIFKESERLQHENIRSEKFEFDGVNLRI